MGNAMSLRETNVVELTNKRWSEEKFNQALKEVRSAWPTGRDVDLDEAIEYHKQMPERKSLPHACYFRCFISIVLIFELSLGNLRAFLRSIVSSRRDVIMFR